MEETLETSYELLADVVPSIEDDESLLALAEAAPFLRCGIVAKLLRRERNRCL